MKERRWLLFSAWVWLAIVIGGSAGLMIYSYKPGVAQENAPKIWPVSSQLARDRDLPTLIMFAHPKCPCTRASIGELDMLMAQSAGQVNAKVVFFRPDGAENWSDTGLWQSAAAIPGVTVQFDNEGLEAQNFHATTSGHVVLYDAHGQLLFSGGITEARGHSGDNSGRSAIVEFLRHGSISNHSTPTFGCPLRESITPAVAIKGP